MQHEQGGTCYYSRSLTWGARHTPAVPVASPAPERVSSSNSGSVSVPRFPRKCGESSKFLRVGHNAHLLNSSKIRRDYLGFILSLPSNF